MNALAPTVEDDPSNILTIPPPRGTKVSPLEADSIDPRDYVSIPQNVGVKEHS